jgi:rhodanese-related sulfurtransferase
VFLNKNDRSGLDAEAMNPGNILCALCDPSWLKNLRLDPLWPNFMGCFWLQLALFLALAVSGGLRAEIVPLGVVFKGELTPLELTYVNKGKTAVHIAQVSPSCDCIEVLQAPGNVPAGADVKLSLVHHAENTGTVEVMIQLLGDKPSEVIKTYTVAGFVADRSWILSPREAQGKGLVLIDTRDPGPFSKLHGVHAINIPAFALKTRTYWHESKLVLMDDGVSPVDLLAEAASLRQQGFAQVFVLSGGLPAWIRAGGRVEGSTQSVLEVARIFAADFARASRAGKWQVVEIGDALTPVPETANVIKLSATDNIERALVSLSRNSAPGMPPNILIIASNNASHAKIEAHLGSAGHLPVFYLNDGMKALAFFHNEQARAASNTGLVFKSAAARGVPIIAGGCSSCGH